MIIVIILGFCDKIYNWVAEISSYVPGDNGMPVYYYDNAKMIMSQAENEEVVSLKVVEETLDETVAATSMTPEIEEMIEDAKGESKMSLRTLFRAVK